MNFELIADIVSELSSLKYYPTDPHGHAAVVRMIGEMATSVDQVEWLIKRATSGIFGEWPGLLELRALFCSRFSPADGMILYSQLYREGFPPERPRLQIAAPKSYRPTPAEIRESQEWAAGLARELESKISGMRTPEPAPTPERAEIERMIEAEVARRRAEKEPEA